MFIRALLEAAAFTGFFVIGIGALLLIQEYVLHKKPPVQPGVYLRYFGNQLQLVKVNYEFSLDYCLSQVYTYIVKKGVFLVIIREYDTNTIKLTLWVNEEPEEPEAVAIEMWYDRSRREWVLYPVDADGNQIAEATYEFSKKDAMNSKKQLEAEYGL